jgi:hypothetical protein
MYISLCVCMCVHVQTGLPVQRNKIPCVHVFPIQRVCASVCMCFQSSMTCTFIVAQGFCVVCMQAGLPELCILSWKYKSRDASRRTGSVLDAQTTQSGQARIFDPVLFCKEYIKCKARLGSAVQSWAMPRQSAEDYPHKHFSS